MEIISNNKTATNTVEVEFKATAEEFEAAVQAAYLKQKKNISIPGFRKGKAPRKMIETQYGEGVFYEDAVNGMYQKAVSEVIDELKLDVVDMPNIEVTEVSKENGVSFKATFTVKPEVEISDYKGLKATKTVKTVSDEEVDAEVQRIRERTARIVDVTDRALQKGDTAVFDFEGFVDGEAFEGGKAEKFSLEIGSGHFIPGFEDAMIGQNIGEDFDVNVTFPEDYNAENLAGKPAVFKCKIHEIKGKEYDELDDEFAKDVSEFDTLDELKADIKAKLQARADDEAKSKLDADLTDMVIEKMQAEVPEAMINNRVDDLVRDWEYRNRNMGITVQDYLKYANITIEQFKENFKEPAEKQVKLRLALEKIAELEKIEVTDEEVENEYKEMAENYKMELDKVKTIVAAEALAEDLKVEKAFDIVRESAEVTEATE
ncbi:MAG: trigger factor [Ruminococcaceae bacterium]|nr:trigger factor [Oscillospiraceae bacterium]